MHMSLLDADALPKTPCTCSSSSLDEEKIALQEKKEIVDKMPLWKFSFVQGLKYVLQSDIADLHFYDLK